MKKNFIAGEWVASSRHTQNINPSNLRDIVGDYAEASLDDVSDAIEAASHAFEAWSRRSPEDRGDILDRIGIELFDRRDELGRLLAREEGKTLPEAVGEVNRASRVFRYFAGEALRIQGEWLPSIREGVDIEIRREAEGVIGVITPWNFPIAIPAWKIAPALAFGNCVIFKPAELTPGMAWALTEIISRSGIPPGVFNLVMGKGATLGAAIIGSGQVRGVSFTGSTRTGALVAQACVSRGAKVQLEMGGKNPLIILADADLDLALEVAVNGAFYSTGQRCTASSRLIVEDCVHDQFVAALATRIKQLRVGDALDPGVDLGPVVGADQLAIDMKYIELGKRDGATLAVGGEALSLEHEGFYLSPALFVGCENTMTICREEIFGPVASVIRASDYDHALSIANDTEFGLSAGICTTSLKYARDFKAKSTAGMVMVNLPTAGVDYHTPFGGRRRSSYGSREQGAYAKEFYTAVKVAYTRA